MNNRKYTIILILCTLFVALFCISAVCATEAESTKHSYILSFALDSEVKNKNSFINLVAENVTENEHTFSWTYGIPVKNGYSFSGWSITPGSTTATIFVDAETNSCSYKLVSSEKNVTSVTLYPVWRIIEYNIDYSLNGGSISGKQDKYTITDCIRLTKPTKNGHTFNGWDVTFYGDYGWIDSTISPETTELPLGQWGSVLLSAKWLVNEYKISFDTSGAAPIEDITYSINSEICLPSITRDGYKLSSWSVIPQGESNWDNMIQGIQEIIPSGLFGNVTLSANWDTIEYSIDFDTNGAGNIDTIYYNILSDNFALPKAMRTGYRFVKWSVESADNKANNWDDNVLSNQEITTGFYGNVLLTAVWEEEEVTFKFIAGNGGTTFPALTDVGVVTGDPMSEATPNPGYRFVGWYYDRNYTKAVENELINSENRVITPIKDENTGLYYTETYYAKFEIITGTLIISVNDTENENGFIFDIVGTPYDSELSEINLTVAVLPGEASVTVCELPAGDYTVTEQDGWSWRFDASEEKDFTLAYHLEDISVEFEFENIIEKWLTRSVYFKKED